MENPAHLIEKQRAQKMELKWEHNKECPKEQHSEPEKGKEHERRNSPNRRRNFNDCTCLNPTRYA